MTHTNYEELDKALIVSALFSKFEARLAHAGGTWTAIHLFKVKCYAQDARDYFQDILRQSLGTPQDYRVDTTCYPAITQLYPSFTSELGDPFLEVCTFPHPGEEPVVAEKKPKKTGENAKGKRKRDVGVHHSYAVFTLNVDTDSEENSSSDDEASDESDAVEEGGAPTIPGALESVEKLALLILLSEHIIAYCDSRWQEVDTSGIDYVALLNSTLEDDVPLGLALGSSSLSSGHTNSSHVIGLGLGSLSDEADLNAERKLGLITPSGATPLEVEFKGKLVLNPTPSAMDVTKKVDVVVEDGGRVLELDAGGDMELDLDVDDILSLVAVVQKYEAIALQPLVA